MATPRKRFFTVECSLYREPWPRELKITMVMLGMHMTDRWAADGLTPAQATVAHLSVGDLMTITGAPSRDESLEILRQLASVISLEVQPLENGFTRIVWRKLSKTQWSQSRKSGSKSGRSGDKVSPKIAPSHPHPHPHPHPQKKNQNSEAAAEPAAAATDPVPAEPEPSDRPPWGPLANLLVPHGAEGVDAEERRAWLERFWPEIDAAAEAESDDGATPRQKSAARKRIALARWRVYVTTNRSIRHEIDERRELKRMADFRDKVYSRPPPVIEPDDGEMPLISIGGSP